MTITLPPELEQRVQEKIELGEYDTPDAFVRTAVERLLMEEEAEIAFTEKLLDEARASGDPIELTDEEWDEIEREAMREFTKRAR